MLKNGILPPNHRSSAKLEELVQSTEKEEGYT